MYRHIPLIGCGLLKHQSRRSCRPSHRFIPVAHAAGTIGILVAVLVLIRIRLLRPGLIPVRAQLVGSHHSQACTDTLPHFGTIVKDSDQTVGIDVDKHIGVINPATGHGAGAKLGLFIRQSQIPASCQQERSPPGQSFQKPATTDISE